MNIAELLAALSKIIAGTTDETAKATLLETLNTGLKPLGFLPEAGVQGLIDTQVLGLKKKNTDLILSEKGLKEKLAAAGITNTDYDDLKNTLSDFGIELDSDGKIDDTKLEVFLDSKRVDGSDAAKRLVELERNANRMEREKKTLERKLAEQDLTMETLKGTFTEQNQFIENKLIDDELKASLIKNGFEEPFIDVLVPSLKIKSKAVVEIDETTGSLIRTAVTDDGKAVGEWVDWFVTTDEGKALKPAPKNHGGQAPGNGGNHGGVNKPYSEMSIGDKVELARADPAKYRQLRDSQ